MNVDALALFQVHCLWELLNLQTGQGFPLQVQRWKRIKWIRSWCPKKAPKHPEAACAHRKPRKTTSDQVWYRMEFRVSKGKHRQQPWEVLEMALHQLHPWTSNPPFTAFFCFIPLTKIDDTPLLNKPACVRTTIVMGAWLFLLFLPNSCCASELPLH